MKNKFILLLSMFLFVACTKEQQEEPIQLEPTGFDFNKPIYMQIEAVHEDGTVINSSIMVLKR